MADMFDFVCGVGIVSRWAVGGLFTGALAAIWERK